MMWYNYVNISGGGVAVRRTRGMTMSQSQEALSPSTRSTPHVRGYLSVKAAAEILGIGERSVRRAIERHKLTSSRLGRMHFIPTHFVSAYRSERKLRQRRAKERGSGAA